MKKILLFFAIVCVAFTSCNDDIFSGGRTTANIGDKILFGGSMKYETAGNKKRTVYGDKLADATEIKWKVGDAVRIYCAEAHGVKECDYVVEDAFNNQSALYDGENDDKYEECPLSLHEDYTEGLLWGTGDHTFYGVYPSPKMMLDKYGEDAEVASAIKLEGNKVTANLPSVQRPIQYVDPVDGNYTIHPAMRYAYMVAIANTDPSKDANVMLKFYPIVTAVEITLTNTGTATIEGITNVGITSTESELCGNFEVEISSKNITRKSTGDSYKSIQIPLTEQNSSIDLEVGKSITFTAFMMPNANLSSLKLTLLYANGVGQKQATISTSNNGIIVEAKKKNFIANVPVNFANAVSKVDLSKWAASISTLNKDVTENEDMTLAKLSIPAAGGAASGHTENWNTNEKYLEQKLTIEQLWDNGIRCFEFTVDYKDNDNDFKNQMVYCNSKASSISLENAVNEVKKKLTANPTEFAMVIITYQQQDGWDKRDQSDGGGSVAYSRKPSDFMTKLNTFWTNISNSLSTKTTTNTVDGQIDITLGTALYSPTMTLAEARGKLFCIARPLSYEEDYYHEPARSWGQFYMKEINKYPSSYSINKNILVIEGWGATKDKWTKRGYTTCYFYRGYGNDSYNKADGDKIDKDNLPGRPFDVASNDDNIGTITGDYISKITLNPNFKYTVKTNSGEYTAWVQEWARVSNLDAQFDGKDDNNNNKEFLWANSTSEKLSNIISSLDKALLSTDNTIYINSLCGYFIDPKEQDSYLPNSITDMSIHVTSISHGYRGLSGASQKAGMCGNISDYTKWINNEFYNYLLTKDLGGKSTGIIMMDRVSDNANDNPAGYYIPRIILANNPFAPGQITEDQPKIKVIDEEVTEDDKFAAPAKRNAINDDNVSIVWE